MSIINLINKYSANRAHYISNQYNETQLRNDFLDPFFELLGWDIKNNAGKPTNEREVILEEAYLNAEQIKIASEMIEHAGAQFVKTSTGFAPHGASVEAVKLIKKNVSENMGIKAAGGIKDYQTYIEMIQAGATRIGTSRGIEIIKEAKKNLQ